MSKTVVKKVLRSVFVSDVLNVFLPRHAPSDGEYTYACCQKMSTPFTTLILIGDVLLYFPQLQRRGR